MAASTDEGTWIIQWYNTNATSLSYAVISGPTPGEAHGHVDAGGDSTGKMWAYLHKPDGRQVQILDAGRIFQITGTNVMESPRRISAATFLAFLDSKPKDYSLSALLDFARTQK